jgi:LytS/YehU family sensor histidine kinase
VVEAYLGVLKVRMGERLKFCVEAAPELMALPVPAMLLQPIVENAVKHGIEPRVHGGSVYVRVHRDDAQLAFVVEDDGVGFAPNAKDNVGLGAVRERLAVQFGRAASLQTERTPEQRTRVTIRIPFPESSAPT